MHELHNRDGQTLATHVYDDVGGLVQVRVRPYSNDTQARSYNQYYRTDISGQVLQRREAEPKEDPFTPDPALPGARYYRFAGVEQGEIGNDPDPGAEATGLSDFTATIVSRGLDGDGEFSGGPATGTPYANFDANHRTLAATSQTGGGGYTARGGETLAQVAQALWGDAQLWYRLAEANGGVNIAAPLAAGQRLTVPAGVQHNTHRAGSAAPYDPAHALGDTQPTTPPAHRPMRCGACNT